MPELANKHKSPDLHKKENIWNVSSIDEKLQKTLINSVGNFTGKNQMSIKEGSSGTAISPQTIMRSEDRQKLTRVYESVKNTLGDKFYDIQFKNDHIEIYLKNSSQSSQFDYTPYMASILEFMINEGKKITPLPEVKLRRDINESQNFFGKTAYYNPQSMEIVLYTHNRHPKDVMRSFTHEMVHHIQNLEGRLTNISTSNVNEDENLMELEKEAYLEGNTFFRRWENTQNSK